MIIRKAMFVLIWSIGFIFTQDTPYQVKFKELSSVQYRVANGDTLYGITARFNQSLNRASLEAFGMNVQTIIEGPQGNVAVGEITIANLNNLKKQVGIMGIEFSRMSKPILNESAIKVYSYIGRPKSGNPCLSGIIRRSNAYIWYRHAERVHYYSQSRWINSL
ncbi:MAG: LysM peptidoglycan-binding domain-containing protein [Planctomycetia bacterium]|nr:LysM peptidoglycan-binding domain-containing protein [Planctomycetia bacterium]